MDKDTQITLNEIEGNYIREQARERLQFSINTLQRSMYELELYLEKLEEAESDQHRAEVMNWSINYLITSIQPNLRIDLLAQSQAELAKLAMCGELK
jgi:threonyl-tRNA synthetase